MVKHVILWKLKDELAGEEKEQVKAGIRNAGGVPFEFNTIGVCDGIAMNHKGMILDDNNPQYVAACIDKMVKDKKLRDYVIEEQNDRLEYYSYDNISAMFKEYLSKFIDKKD